MNACQNVGIKCFQRNKKANLVDWFSNCAVFEWAHERQKRIPRGLTDGLISWNKRVVNPSIWHIDEHTHTHTHTFHRKVCAYCIAPTLQNEWGGAKLYVMLTVHYCMTCVINILMCVRVSKWVLFIKWMRYFASHQHLELCDFSEHRFKNGICTSKKEIGSSFITFTYFILVYFISFCMHVCI